MNILISGAGIAGSTLAFWLAQYGFKPTLVEQAPRLRTGGYIIDFWGAGFDIAEKMGILPSVLSKGYQVQEIRAVDATGQRVSGFSVDVFSRMTQGRYTSLARGDLASVIYDSLGSDVETIFDDSIKSIKQHGNAVQVDFITEPSREFDLVIGADGLHSNVRELVFGPQSRFEKYLGYNVAAFEVKGYQPRDELVYTMHTEIGKQIARFSMRDDRTLFLFINKENEDINEHQLKTLDDQKKYLHKHYDKVGWECPEILKVLDNSEELYFDRISQIKMENIWSDNRVALLGDAASCVSLLGGQGSALAMTAAYILAGELHNSKGNYSEAFSSYHKLFAPFVFKKQKAAERFGGAFAPKTAFGLFFRNQAMKLLSVSWIADQVIGRDLSDNIKLPEYHK